MSYTVAEAAKRTGLTAHTLRYYDREGLLPFVERAPSGFRAFEESDFEWLSVITCLKNTGMQIKDIRRYIDWSTQGDATLEQRLRLFQTQKAELTRQIAQMQRHMQKIEHKIQYYEEACRLGSEAAVKGGCRPVVPQTEKQ